LADGPKKERAACAALSESLQRSGLLLRAAAAGASARAAAGRATLLTGLTTLLAAFLVLLLAALLTLLAALTLAALALAALALLATLILLSHSVLPCKLGHNERGTGRVPRQVAENPANS
jgi:hypothetical protein